MRVALAMSCRMRAIFLGVEIGKRIEAVERTAPGRVSSADSSSRRPGRAGAISGNQSPVRIGQPSVL